MDVIRVVPVVACMMYMYLCVILGPGFYISFIDSVPFVKNLYWFLMVYFFILKFSTGKGEFSVFLSFHKLENHRMKKVKNFHQTMEL